MLRLLVKLHAGFKSRDRDLDLALLHAVKAGFLECTEILLSAGANPNTTDAHGNTPLIHACEIGNYGIVKLLTDVGCNVNKSSNIKCTALHHAAKWGFKDCLELLLVKDAHVDGQDAHWRTPVMLAATHAQDANQVMSMLIDAGCDVNIVGFEGRRVIHYAASRGLDLDDIIKAGADIECGDDEGNQALHYGAFEGCPKVVKSLLNAGACANSMNFTGRNPVHLSAIRGHLPCVQSLVEAGGDPSVIDHSGKSAICHAVENNNLSVVTYFIQYNCPSKSPTDLHLDPHVTYVDPVSVALEKRFIQIVRALVIGGFHCKPLFDWLNHTPEELWVEGNIEHVSWLKEFLSTPPPLSHLVRLTIREHVGINIPEKLQFLPLPSKIKEYIQFTELSDRSFQTFSNEDSGHLRELCN